MSSLIQAATSLVEGLSPAANEMRRQLAYEDNKFWNDYLCFFEFAYTYKGISYAYLFPIMYSPSQYQISEPFLMEATNTLDGGLYVEESGVSQRRISIQAHQGVLPHLLQNTSVPSPNIDSRNYLHNASLHRNGLVLSGQKHFQYLQQSVFRTYSDLKRDPTQATDVHLYWHNPQDDEHFEIVPISFGMQRSNSSAMLYPYQIEMLCIGPANAGVIAPAGSNTFLTKLQDARRVASAALSTLQGAVADINTVLNDVKLVGQSYIGLLSQVDAIVSGVGNFVSGVKSIIDLPLSAVLQAIASIENAMAQYTDAVAAGKSVVLFPETIRQRWRQMQDALEILGTQPSLFQSSTYVSVQRLNTALLASQVSQTETASPTGFNDINRAGTANLPGDAQIAAGRDTAASSVPIYLSISQYMVRQGDSLASIALSLLGDSQRYRDIVILNNLPTPISNSGCLARASATDPTVNGRVLYVGQVLAIPSTLPVASYRGAAVVLGAKDSDTPEAQVFGTDVALNVAQVSVSGSALYDIAYAVQSDGSYDLGTRSGLSLVQQAVTQQVTQESGSNKLFAGVGLAAVVPTGLTDVDYEQMRFRVSSALLKDPRVATIQRLDVTTPVDLSTVQINASLLTINGSGTQVAT